MYTLINDLWTSQQTNPFQFSINIPLTIIIQQGFKISWYFSRNNKILKKKSQNCSTQTIIEYLKQNNIEMNIITIQKPYQIEGFGQIQLKNEAITIENIQQLLIHYSTYPNIIENPVILQENFKDGQFISLKWNKYYTFIQECDKYSYEVNQHCIKLTPHYRQQINLLSTQLVQRISQINQSRGQLNEMNIIICVQDKPQFLWCTEMKFTQEQLVRNEDEQYTLWSKIRDFKLSFNQSIKHQRCKSTLECQNITYNNQNITQNNQNNSSLQLNLAALVSHRAHNVSQISNTSNSKQGQQLFTQLKSSRSNNTNINIKQLLSNNHHNQSDLSTQRPSRGGSVLRQLTNRSFSNRSQSMYKVQLNDEKPQQVNMKKSGAVTQRTQQTEPNDQESVQQIKISKTTSKIVHTLRQRLQEIKLKQLS